MKSRHALRSPARDVRLWTISSALYLLVSTRVLAETFFETRYQYYQEDDKRIRVDSSYSMFSIDLRDTLVLDGTLLYSAISGASPTGLPPYVKGGPVPTVAVTDERYAVTIGLTKQIGNHSLKGGFAYSTESDYTSFGYSIQDTISLNQKNTELVFGFAFDNDTVGENGTSLSASKLSYDAIIGVHQVLGPNDLLSLNLSLGWRRGLLSDPYKRVLMNSYYVLPDTRPDHKFEQLVFVQWTHYLTSLGASMETSYRFGHNDEGSHSHTFELAFYKKFLNDRLTLGPSFRYYRQTAASFYDTEFFGQSRYHSSDYRVSAEETFSVGLHARYFLVKDKFALDAAYERYTSRGLDHKTSQSAYPDSNSVTVGFHYQF